MPTIYKDQPYKLILETNTDLSGAGTLQIRFKKPSGTIGTWTATDDGTTVFYNLSGAENNEQGVWRFHSWITFVGDSNPTPGEVARLDVRPLYE